MIARKSALIVGTQFFARFLGWIGLVILAKLWGGFAPEAMGIIGFAMAFLALFTIIADFGFSHAHIKKVSEGKDLGTCISTFSSIKVILVGLMVLIVFIAIYIWKNLLHRSFFDATTESVIVVFIVYYVFMNLRQISVITFQGKKEIAKRQLVIMFEGIIKVPLMILVALAGVSAVTVSISPAIDWPVFLQPFQQFLASHAVGSLAMTYVFGAMVTLFVGMRLLRKYPWKKPSWKLFKSYCYFALPVMLVSLMSIISLNIDKVMIGYFWTSVEVGYYFAVQQIIQIFIILSAAVGTVLFPTLSEYHSSKNFERIKQTTHLTERYISMVLIPPIVIVILFAKPVINIMLNSAFLPASSVLITLVIYALIYGLRIPYHSLISGMNEPGIAARIGIAICATNIILNYLFIPECGLLSPFGISGPTGAAIATVLSSLVGLIGFQYTAKKLTGIRLFQSYTPRHIIAGIVMAVVLYYSSFVVPVDRWYQLLGYSLYGLGIYLLVLFALKEFKKHDLNFFLNMLHPKEMFDYISSELRDKPKPPQ